MLTAGSLPANRFQRILRPSLFRREVREVISPTALELLLGTASYMVEGEWAGRILRGEFSPALSSALSPALPQAKLQPQRPSQLPRDGLGGSAWVSERGREGPTGSSDANLRQRSGDKSEEPAAKRTTSRNRATPARRKSDPASSTRARRANGSAENAFVTVMLTLDLGLVADSFDDLLDRYAVDRLAEALPHEPVVRKHLDRTLQREFARQGAPWNEHRGWALDIHANARGTRLLIDGDAVVSMPATIAKAR